MTVAGAYEPKAGHDRALIDGDGARNPGGDDALSRKDTHHENRTGAASDEPAPRSSPPRNSVCEHEATPWELSPQGYIIPNVANPMAFLRMKSPWREGAWDDDPGAAANAAFIVEAVNNHARLTAELERARKELADLREAARIFAALQGQPK